MHLRQLGFPVQLILAGFSPRVWPAVAAVILFALLQATLVISGSYLDGTWWLPHGGKGFLNHYGVWAILIADPLALFATAIAWRQFVLAMAELPLDTHPVQIESAQRIISPYIRFIKLRGRGIFLYALMVLVGMLGWLNNIYQTTDPVRFFGHKVFDSTEYILGFVANKFVLFVSWVLIYPACGFVTLTICISTFLILQRLKSKGLIIPSVFHPDGCYGFSALGKLNVCLMIPFLIAFLVLFSILVTHARVYTSIVVPLVFLTTIFLAASVMTIYPVASQAKEMENIVYSKLRSQSKYLSSLDLSSALSFGNERLCFALSTGSPYSKNAKTALIILRLIPVTVTITNLVSPLL
jgi:hypothetical protein